MSLALRIRLSNRCTLGGVLAASLVDSRCTGHLNFNLCLLGSIGPKTGSKSFGGFGGLNNVSSFLESFLP